MLVRLILIAVVGFVLNGYVPRWLATGEAAWTVWAAAAVIVLAGPRLARSAMKRTVRQLGASPVAVSAKGLRAKMSGWPRGLLSRNSAGTA